MHRLTTSGLAAARAVFAAATLSAIAALPLPAQNMVPQSARYETVYAEISTALDDVRAIENHTHIVYGASFDERFTGFMPLIMRQDMKRHLDLAQDLFGTRDPAEAKARRDARVAAEGGAYSAAHLDATRTDLALVNTMQTFDDAGGRLLRVPFASYLLYPLPADNVPLHPEAAAIATRARDWLTARAPSGETAPGDLESYMSFVDGTLAAWAEEGVVAIKFVEGLSRPLVYGDTTRAEANALFMAGLVTPLSRADYLRLQDFIARSIFLNAPAHGLAVHIHVGAGNPPFLRLGDNAVANLENLLADPKFFGTQFVLIHGGFPEVEAAAYQSLRPNVWIDLSAQALFVPPRDLAANIRTYLSYSPQSVLFGTDASSFPHVPGGPEVQHHVLSRRLRHALADALAQMVAQDEITPDQAIAMGQGVLRGNAQRLYGL